MLPPFLPFTVRPLRRVEVKRVPAALLRELIAVESHSIRGERLNLKSERLPAYARLRVLDRG